MNFKTLLAFIVMLIGTGLMYVFTWMYLMIQGKSADEAFYWSTAFMIMTVCGNAYVWKKI
jgi:biotin transporter BioY